ncbi:NDP-hexose 2,3-dehydratase family protein, partial [Arthrospira platensis SPKY1]|nr:NDP-hexose 2,3-dehydratase family protein [Arthrospira platensis SPKY1]
MQANNQIVNINLSFLKSAFSKSGFFLDRESVIDWLISQNKKIVVNVKKVDFNNLDQWRLSDTIICHQSGKFFSIEAIRVLTNWGNISEWEQPIINQPEIGYLGFITK